jgi:hypothetical protein
MFRITLAAAGIFVLALVGCRSEQSLPANTRAQMNCSPSDPDDPSAYLGCVRGQEARQRAPAGAQTPGATRP